jgi:hypothetical protein
MLATTKFQCSRYNDTCPCSTTCSHSKVRIGCYRVDSPPFAVGKVRTSRSQVGVAGGVASEDKNRNVKVRAGRIFASRGVNPNAVDSIGAWDRHHRRVGVIG